MKISCSIYIARQRAKRGTVLAIIPIPSDYGIRQQHKATERSNASASAWLVRKCPVIRDGRIEQKYLTRQIVNTATLGGSASLHIS